MFKLQHREDAAIINTTSPYYVYHGIETVLYREVLAVYAVFVGAWSDCMYMKILLVISVYYVNTINKVVVSVCYGVR